ncbi:MAG: extracellular solute-binding protein [Acidibacillus sp.]|uniref:Sn-glycerol-3-phosphate-binding periplasmic protein UgpB n=1 Tax=Sulfoacidibacillus ferrooxidans TaxID=2005001 RepID=A0A9X2ADS7_9BACL|nr:extracellular solute-binding protein [Sulfoacidibacillus ferrooxidans]MCI0182411.1 sn-glycerol-3-phosphate-binding periplasmic protein UgpB [Sulfoacidibacillus ferrooxidans]MCY0893622.1 extracellular solute-binding protein [Acidibacillus sp.]
MKMKTISLGVLLVLSSSIALTGCGSQSAAQSTTNPTTSSANIASTSSSTPVQVTFWEGMSGQLGQVLQQMVQKFNATHPGIHVNAVYQGSYSGDGPLQEKLMAAIASGKVPDMVQLEIHSTPLFASSGALQPLDSYMASSKNDQKSDFLPGLLNNTSYQGTTYGIPFNRSVPVLYYNPTLFAAAHIQTAPATWAQLAQDAAKLTKKSNGTTSVYGFEPVNQWWFFESLVWSDGGHLLNPTLTEATFDTPQAEAGMKLWQTMQSQGTLAVNAGPNEWTQTIEDFGHGRTAMYIGSAGDMGQIAQTGVTYRTAFMPKFTQYAVPTGGANAVIMQKAPAAQKAAAWTFIKWFTSVPQTIEWSEQTGYLPVKQAALSAPALTSYYAQHPNHKVPVEELAYAKQAPLSPDYLQVYQYIQDAMDQIMDSQTPVSTALHQAVQKSDQALSQPQ